jgi:hypothetical protein
MHRQIIFGLITNNFVSDTIYHSIQICFVIMLFILVHCVYVCRIMDGGCLNSAPFNQDTQANIESYHGALKHWLALNTKGVIGCRIDWLVWRLTTTIAHHYMHTLEI